MQTRRKQEWENSKKAVSRAEALENVRSIKQHVLSAARNAKFRLSQHQAEKFSAQTVGERESLEGSRAFFIFFLLFFCITFITISLVLTF